MTEEQIKYMVDRFLSWKLPDNFSPDAGISFDPPVSWPWPTGTNLLDATQADAMVRHMVEGLPAVNSHATLTAALEEARGALEPIKSWVDHLSAIGSRRLADNESPDIYGAPDMGDLRYCVRAIATINAALGRVE